MVNLFHDMMHKDMEVYVGDMIVKSHTEKEHIEVLRRLFISVEKISVEAQSSKMYLWS